MESFLYSQVFEIHHLILIICVLLVALLVVGGGKGLGKLLGPLVKKILGREEINIKIGGEMANEKYPAPGLIDHKKCPAHQAEYERSLRNEEEYKKLWNNYGKLRDEVIAGFKEVNLSISESQKTILAALASRRGEI